MFTLLFPARTKWWTPMQYIYSANTFLSFFLYLIHSELYLLKIQFVAMKPVGRRYLTE